MGKIPTNIISGFLGSGKTTAIIRLLNQKPIDECWAVIVNEFGKVSIDGQTLRSKSDTGSVYEISGGCICCSAKGFLSENLGKIITTSNYDRIIIEPSGLGGIKMVSEIIDTFPDLLMMPVICLVDITGMENPRLQQSPIYQVQIRKADRIIFSKCDLLDSVGKRDQLIVKFQSVYTGKKFCITGTQLSPSLLHSDIFQKNEKPGYRLLTPSDLDPKDHNYQEKYFQFGADRIFNSGKLKEFFNENPTILRAKGYIRAENGWALFNYTLSGCIFEPCQAKEQNELVLITEKIAIDNYSVEKLLIWN